MSLTNTRRHRSARERERKKLYDAKRRRQKLLLSLQHVLHVSHAPQFLKGDEPIHVPPYIAYVLTLGPKFVPHTSPTFAYKTFRKALFRELPELERVLL